MRKCRRCERPIEDRPRQTGRPSAYCSEECRRAQHREWQKSYKQALRDGAAPAPRATCLRCEGPMPERPPRPGPKPLYCSPECRQAADADSRAKWRKANRHVIQRSHRLLAENARAEVAEAKAAGCSSCGETDPTVLDFHHVRGPKLFTIGSGAKRVGVATLRAEIAKCEVLCANCHRRAHAQKSAA